MKFFRLIVITVINLSILIMGASFAFGESFYEQYKIINRDVVKAQCTDEQIGVIPNGTVNGIRAVDLTNQSEACLVRVLDAMSTNRQIIFVESENVALRQQTLTAAQRIQEETGDEVLIVLYKDIDASDDRAYVTIWSDGHERASHVIKEDYGINEIVLNANDFISETVRISKEVMELKALADQNRLATMDESE